MRIQHNISALNAHRQLGSNNNAVAKNLEKLSSGYAINRAADNAAGLAISEKMRGQIRGLDQAQANAQDGISLIQTAEGALNETHDILQRMRELSVQSANGTYQNDVDRENIQKEVDALKGEIDRIASSTHYNKINLLDGSLASGGATAGVGGKNDAIKVNVSTDAKANGTYGYVAATQGSFTSQAVAAGTVPTTANSKYEYTVRVKENGIENQYTVSLTMNADNKLQAADGTVYSTTTAGATQAELSAALTGELNKTGLKDNFTISSATGTPGVLTMTAKEAGSTGAQMVGFSATATTASGVATTVVPNVTQIANSGTDGFETFDVTQAIAFNGKNADKAIFEVNGEKFAFADTAENALLLDSDVNVITLANPGAGNAPAAADATTMSALINQKTGLATDVNGNNIQFKAGATTGTANNAGGGLTFQIGANGSKDQRVSLSVDDMSTKGIGVSNISVSTQTAANKSIEIVDKAINTVSKQRAGLGALQNRLEHTVNNLGTTSENLTSSEARIRDVDMAKEMVNMSKNNILTQAAQAMLAQANTQPQGVLQLLK